MCNRDKVRSAIRSFNKAEWTKQELKGKLPDVTRYGIDQEIAYLLKSGEISQCGSMNLRTGGKRIFYREVKMVEKYTRPEIERKEPDLKGMRKVWPQFFTDPHIPGKSRFIDNGLRQ